MTRRQFVATSVAGVVASPLVAQQSFDKSLNIPWQRLPNWLDPSTHALKQPQSNETIAANIEQNAILRLRAWVDLNLELIVKYQQNPLRAARALAYTHATLRDAWTCAQSDASLASRSLSERLAGSEIAATRAAYSVLEHFYPNETPGIFASRFALAQMQIMQTFTQEPIAASLNEWMYQMAEYGRKTAELAIQRSLRDGAGRVWALGMKPTEFHGMWQAAYPLYAVNPLEAFAGEWRPWISVRLPLYVPPAVARLGSDQHTRETQEVWQIAQTLTASQQEIAQRWHLEAGSVTPGGIWTKLAWDAGLDHLNSARAKARGSIEAIYEFLAAMSATAIAIFDAFIACWQVKYRDWSERPITAIRRQLQANFIPLLVTPSFPSYVSGHATISAAAARVLGAWLPNRAMHFEALAQEAALSRLYGGIHFRSDNDQGLLLGQSVANNLLRQLSSH